VILTGKFNQIKIIWLAIITLFHIGFSLDKPMIYIEKYKGLLGNQLFQFCLGKILSKELNIGFSCPPIYGFPETYLYNNGIPSSQYPIQKLTGHVIDFKDICSNKTPRNLLLDGYFQRYEYYKAYTNDIKFWLRFDEKITPKNSNDIVIHIRLNNQLAILPFKYYEDALNLTEFNKLYICTNEPQHPFIKKFDKFNPIIKTIISLNELFSQDKTYEEIIRLTIDDFKFIASFNKIITSQSTFSWWAAFLSEAHEIYAPIPDKGYMSEQRPDLQWRVEEDRYHYIICSIDRNKLKYWSMYDE